MNKIRVFILIAGILYVVYLLGKTFIGDYLLKAYGKCDKAFLTRETVSVKYSKPTLVYSFEKVGKIYEQNSLEEDLSKAGDSICILYLEKFPLINRPTKYFEQQELPCGCN